MNLWNTILANSDAIFADDGSINFPDTPSDTSNDQLLVTPLVKDIIQVSGPDSKKFLQGQTTCNLDDLSDNTWSPGAICDPKGRMFTSFSIYQQSADQLLLEMHPGLAEITLNAINKYSAFFKTDLKNTNQSYGVMGIMGATAKQTAEQLLDVSLPSGMSFIQLDDCLIIPLEDTRIKVIATKPQLENLWQTFSAHGKPCSNSHWQMADIQQGIGEVSIETSGELIPQMINLQARNGISFKKGCYTGQEIVARMKYLGKLKRRLYRIQLMGGLLPKPGQNCYSLDKTNNQGSIVCATNNGDYIEALAVMTEPLAGEKQVVIDQQPAQSFIQLPLPYSLD